MESVFIAKGNGYAGDTCFDGFDVIAEPCAERESRIFGQLEDKPGTGTCYRAYSIKLAVRVGDTEYKQNRALYLLIQHGGGREVMALPTFYDRGDLKAALLAMPERIQYATLFTIYQTARNAADTARDSTVAEWAQAHCDGRIKKSRAKQGRRRVWIDPPPPAAPTV